MVTNVAVFLDNKLGNPRRRIAERENFRGEQGSQRNIFKNLVAGKLKLKLLPEIDFNLDFHKTILRILRHHDVHDFGSRILIIAQVFIDLLDAFIKPELREVIALREAHFVCQRAVLSVRTTRHFEALDFYRSAGAHGDFNIRFLVINRNHFQTNVGCRVPALIKSGANRIGQQ